jgi:hypothetical protein
MSVVRGQARRRWFLVAGGVAVICALPVAISALPVAVGRPADVGRLRAQIMRSADVAYQGYAESDGALGVPNLRELSDISAMLDGATRMRVWQASASRWRVDALSDVGEHDTYQVPGATFVWDSGSELLTRVAGTETVRLPRAADLVPPVLALRILRDAGSDGRVTGIGGKRVAGIAAPGLRLAPSDPETTIGHVDIWADPRSGLPLQVEITGRGSGRVMMTSRFLQVSFARPAPAALTPRRGPGTGFSATRAADIASAIGSLDDEQLPGVLAGRARVPPPPSLQEIGIYGDGLSRFAVIAIRGRTGRRDLRNALNNGGTPLTLTQGIGAQIVTPVITVVLMHPNFSFDTFLIAGFTKPELLVKAADELSVKPDRDI